LTGWDTYDALGVFDGRRGSVAGEENSEREQANEFLERRHVGVADSVDCGKANVCV
jgi:hypothetical protein